MQVRKGHHKNHIHINLLKHISDLGRQAPFTICKTESCLDMPRLVHQLLLALSLSTLIHRLSLQDGVISGGLIYQLEHQLLLRAYSC